MLTVDEVTKIFAEKRMPIEIPFPGNWLVRGMEVLERQISAGSVGLVMRFDYVDEQGNQVSDVFFCRGRMDPKEKRPQIQTKPIEALKSELLPPRDKTTFVDEEEAMSYLKEAMSHLLKDKGYQLMERSGVDLYFEKEGHGLFINLAARCNEKGFEKAKELVELRRRHGSDYDYGLAVPAFQESLGIPLRLQERWVWTNNEFLCAHRIGVFAVDNHDPNRIYPLTIYPKARELVRYFIVTSQQWALVRDRYVATRARRSGN